MDTYLYFRIKVTDKWFLITCFYMHLMLYSYQAYGASIAPCTVENYIAPSTKYEIDQVKINLAADVKLAFQSGDQKLFYGLLCRAAAAHIVEAEIRLGAMHMKDWGFIKQNYYYARYWLERAFAQGHLKASYLHLLGTIYLEGKGGPVKGQQGVELMLKAAKAGDPNAMLELSLLYTEGVFVLQSIDSAIYWAQQSKQAGHPTGQKLLDKLKYAPSSMRR